MIGARPRIHWTDLPQRVRAAVERVLGDEVVEARSQTGGFSPGSADRVLTRSGRRAFVKAVSPAQNADSPAVHRRELRISGALPTGIPVPRLLGSFDDGEWVVLVFDDVDGREPALPWARAELDAALESLDELARALTPSPVAHAPALVHELSGDFRAWEAIRERPPTDLDPWLAASVDTLLELSLSALPTLDGDTLLHVDIRADNMLVTVDGRMMIVDWPWASRGADWFDMFMLVANARIFDPALDADAVLASTPRLARVPAEHVTGAIAGLTGHFLNIGRQPPVPGLPTVRAFQLAQGHGLAAWLRQRLEGDS